ncbi:MAG: S41 family peptidase [Bacteroidales bacterium]|jgi:carboxyl-terminal processing protease|nr:S41 family peptidase [Bacteroidales bacterium]
MKIRNQKSKFIGITAIIVLLVSVSFAALSDKEFQIVKNMDIFFSLFRELNLFYVDETDPEKLIGSSIEGMLATLDPYTTFIPESEMEDYKTVTTGQYGGIGASIRDIENAMTITEVSRNNPADKAGLRAGDMLMKIDGQWLTGKTESEVDEMLNGVPNTKLSITYLQAHTKHEITRELARETITIPNVPYYGTLDDANRVGYIRLSNFSANAGKEVKDALTSLKKTYNIESLVLDVRNNPGGLLVEAVEVVNLFVKRGQEVVSTRGRVKQWDNIYMTRHEPVDTIIPLAVVVNRLSASASEIVAGAIQDLDRGVIVGQRTFGKGLVQATRSLSYNTQLKVTTAKYYIPSGRCIQALDYTHREADGSVGYIPDSLIREYRTLKNSRTVRDGGGVSPDVEALPETLSRIAVTLYVRNLIFSYATEYVQKHDSIAPAKRFALTDKEYEDYVAYLQDKFFDYQTETELTFQKLKDIAIREKYMEDASPEFEALHAKLSHDRFKDLELFKDDIKELVEEEISSRYYYNAGRIANTMRKDSQIRKAADALHDTKKYASLLNQKQ